MTNDWIEATQDELNAIASMIEQPTRKDYQFVRRSYFSHYGKSSLDEYRKDNYVACCAVGKLAVVTAEQTHNGAITNALLTNLAIEWKERLSKYYINHPIYGKVNLFVYITRLNDYQCYSHKQVADAIRELSS